jgi:hypothetical protein
MSKLCLKSFTVVEPAEQLCYDVFQLLLQIVSERSIKCKIRQVYKIKVVLSNYMGLKGM